MTKLLKIATFIFVDTFLIQTIVSNHMSIKTQELNQTSQQISNLKSQISLINQEMYLSSSIIGMEEKAMLICFGQMEQPVKSVSSPTIARAF